eukprot:scaffold4435_cov88-Isochrysis_galbana.AAC.2
MGSQHHCSAVRLDLTEQALLHQLGRDVRVHSRERVVEQEDGRPAVESASKGEARALPSGYGDASLADLRVVTDAGLVWCGGSPGDRRRRSRDIVAAVLGMRHVWGQSVRGREGAMMKGKGASIFPRVDSPLPFVPRRLPGVKGSRHTMQEGRAFPAP